MTEFRVGDRVQLTGELWNHGDEARCYPDEPYWGDIVTITAIHDGEAWFRDRGNYEWFVSSDSKSIYKNHWTGEPV